MYLLNMIKITKSNFDYNIILFSDNQGGECNTQLSFDNIVVDNIDNKNDNLSAYYRAKHVIRDYAKNNIFNYFVTITIDSNKFDVTADLDIKAKLLKYFNNLRNRYDKSFRYILVAERGKKNDRLHFHGLIYLENTVNLYHLNGKNYRDEWLFNNFGANRFTKIKEYNMQCVNYISKYIVKEEFENKIYKYNYFCSKGLKRSKEIYTDVRSTLPTYLDTLKDRMFKSLVVFLQDNNLFVYYEFCSFASIPISMFEDFISSHNFIIDKKTHQLTFNDLFFMKGEC